MSFTPYLDRYLEGLQALPAEVRRNFMLMRNIDIRNQDLAKTIDKYTSDYLEDNMTASPEVKKVKMTEIQEMFDKAKEYSDDKVQLAIQTYEFVDKHIRKLDADLARLEIDQQERSFGKSLSNEETTIKKKRGRKKACEKEKAAASGIVGTASSVQGRKVKRAVSGKSTVGGAKGVPAGFASVSLVPPLIHPTDSIDMPVDPNEPTYCLCNQVSYGEMIGCDNSDCPIEWFHFPCVNLTTKPKGKWYCPRCSLDRKKK